MTKLPVKKYEPTEKQIMDTIIEFLTRKGFFVWRNNTGAQAFSYKGKTRFIRFGQPGHADILGVAPGGQFIAIEVKRSERQKPTQEQQDFLHRVRTCGGIGLVAWSVEQVAQRLGEAL